MHGSVYGYFVSLSIIPNSKQHCLLKGYYKSSYLERILPFFFFPFQYFALSCKFQNQLIELNRKAMLMLE